MGSISLTISLRPYFSEYSTATLIFISVGCCVACCVAASTTGTKKIVQSAQIKACMNVLDEESKRKENILLQLVIDGTIAGGAYVQYVKCTIKK